MLKLGSASIGYAQTLPRTVAEHLSRSLMLLRFVPMRSGSQECRNVVSRRPFTAATRVQIPPGTPNKSIT